MTSQNSKSIKLTNYSNIRLLSKLIKVFRTGGLVVLPTDTVYGLICDATNKEAVSKLIQFKSRPVGKPISVFAGNLSMAKKLVLINKKQYSIINKILPGPYTLVFSSKHRVDRRLESETGTLGIRIPQYDLINQLVLTYGKPLTATSANLAGKSVNYSINSLLNTLSASKKNLIDLIVDSGKLPHNKPSTVIDYSGDNIEILRHGDLVPVSQIETKNEKETFEVGMRLLSRNDNWQRPTVFLFEGDMGVGKTIMIKGIGKFLGIEKIVSPTFVLYYEYVTRLLRRPSTSLRIPRNDKILRHCSSGGAPAFVLRQAQDFGQAQRNDKVMLYHFDLFRIEDKQELKDLPFEDIIKKPSIICIEWGEKSQEIIDLLKSKAKIIYIKMEYINENKRKILISQKSKIKSQNGKSKL